MKKSPSEPVFLIDSRGLGGNVDHLGATHSAKNEWIHGLRGLLAFMVFCFHIENSGLPTFHGPIADVVNLFFASMRHGVEIFFGISGIVIFYSYQNSKSARSFFINRVTRILPVLWATIFIILLGAKFDRRHDDSLSHFGILTTIGNLLAFPTVVPIEIINPTSWTLSYEFAFYMCFVLFSFVAIYLGRLSATTACVLVATVLLLSHLKALLFLTGVLVVINSRRIPVSAFIFRFPVLSIALAMMIWDQSFSMFGSRSEDINILQLLHSSPFSMLLFALATVLASIGLIGVFFGNGEAKYLNNRLMRWLGTISFSFYMWQPITAAISKKIIIQTHLDVTFGPWSQIVFFLFALPATLMLAHISQLIIEDRITRALRSAFQLRRKNVVQPG